MSGAEEVKACRKCGKHFFRARGLSAKQWSARAFCSKRCAGLKRRVTDAEVLGLYRSGMSSTEVGELLGISAMQVSRIVRAYGEVRSASERQALSHSRPEVRKKFSAAAKGRACQERVKDVLRERTGSKNAQWRSGLTLGSGGYLVFTASSANGEHAGLYLHKVIAEWKIGRALKKGEVVHHTDGNKLNNDPNNLEVMTHSAHARLHALQRGFGRKSCQAA